MILITGATGFLGRFLVQEFAQAGYDVRALVRRKNHPAVTAFPAKVTLAEGDLLDVPSLVEAMREVQFIIHAGAMVSFQRKDQAVMRKVNEEGTANVVNVALEADVKKIVNVSSVSALARAGSTGIITEKNTWKESKLNPYYGKTKYLAEKQIFRGVEEGLPAVQALPTLIMGAGDWSQGTPKLFQQIASGYPFVPSGTNGWVGAEDVARGCRLLLESDFQKGERFILCSENLTYEKAFRLIAESVGKKAPSLKVGKGIGAFIGSASERLAEWFGQEALVTAESARTAGQTYRYDSSLFQKTFDYSFEPMAEVFKKMALAYLKR
jgi:nucleoside-diphosphate-sugar epimerase